jgi:hypothetical protein
VAQLGTTICVVVHLAEAGDGVVIIRAQRLDEAHPECQRI